MNDNVTYGSSEEKFLREMCERESFLNRQDENFDRKSKFKQRLVATCEKLAGIFPVHKKMEKEVEKDNPICLEKATNKEGNNKNSFDFKKILEENSCQNKQEINLEEEILKAKARNYKEYFIKFVESRLKENKSSELFEMTKDEFDRTIIHAFSKEHSVRNSFKFFEGDYEGFVNVDNGDGIEKCYYHITYFFESDNSDVLYGYIINEEGNVYFLKEKVKIGSQSFLTNICHKADRVIDDMIKKLKEKENKEESHNL